MKCKNNLLCIILIFLSLLYINLEVNANNTYPFPKYTVSSSLLKKSAAIKILNNIWGDFPVKQHLYPYYSHPYKSFFSYEFGLGLMSNHSSANELSAFSQHNYFMNPMLSIGLVHQIFDHIAARISINTGYEKEKYNPNDAVLNVINTEKSSFFIGMDITGLFSINSQSDFAFGITPWNIYGILGIGSGILLSQSNSEIQSEFLSLSTSNDYNMPITYLPFGIGLEYRFNDFMSISLEATNRLILNSQGLNTFEKNVGNVIIIQASNQHENQPFIYKDGLFYFYSNLKYTHSEILIIKNIQKKIDKSVI